MKLVAFRFSLVLLAVTSSAYAHHHGREKMLLVDAGPYHAALTAHLAKAGNELDIFFETSADKPTFKALPFTKFMAQAISDKGEKHSLTFVCAPASERPKGEKMGECSHFVADAHWMKRTDSLRVMTRKLKLGEKRVRVGWNEFNPLKYAHHIE